MMNKLVNSKELLDAFNAQFDINSANINNEADKIVDEIILMCNDLIKERALNAVTKNSLIVDIDISVHFGNYTTSVFDWIQDYQVNFINEYINKIKDCDIDKFIEAYKESNWGCSELKVVTSSDSLYLTCKLYPLIEVRYDDE